MKSKHPLHTMVLEAVSSNSDVMPLFTFPHSLRLNTVLRKALGSRGWLLKDPTASNRIMRHATQPEQFGQGENCDHIIPNTRPLTPMIAISLII